MTVSEEKGRSLIEGAAGVTVAVFLKDKAVLMSALTVTEVMQFESLVEELDPQAFVIVTPAREVMGSGFVPLSDAQKAAQKKK